MSRRLQIALAAVLALVVGTPAAHARDPVTGNVLVTLTAQAAESAAAPQARLARAHAVAARAVAARAGARVVGAPLPALALVTLAPGAGESAAALARALRADPAVASAEVERRMALRYVPNDPALVEVEAGAPEGTVVQWWAARQGFPAAWDRTRGEGAVVAVIDTGIEASHPEFANRIVGSADFDDTTGHGPATVDEIGHGTHVASMACAAADNAIGLAGAGFGCSLLVAKSDLSEGSVARSIVWAADNGADAINMSFGTDGTQPAASVTVQAIDYALTKDVVLVAAAADEVVEEQGDPSNVLQPTGSGAEIAAGKGLSVTAAAANDQRAGFAGRGSQISLAAYGAYGAGGPTGLLGAFPAAETELERGSFVPPQPPCRCRAVFGGDARYARLQGTSMASPMVTAIAALVRDLNPDLPALEVVRLLKETARRAPGASWDPELGWGILDAGAALTAAATRDRRPPHSRVRVPARPRRATITLRLGGADEAPEGVTKAGIATYEIWRSAAGRPARRIARTRKLSFRVRGRPGARYAFFTIAIDRAGNREAAPARPDVRVAIARD